MQGNCIYMLYPFKLRFIFLKKFLYNFEAQTLKQFLENQTVNAY